MMASLRRIVDWQGRFSPRRVAIVVSLTLAAVLVLLSYTGPLVAQDAEVITWSVSATTLWVDDASGDAWFANGARTSISRLEPPATSTATTTVTTWPIPVGGVTWDGTTVFGTTTQKLYFTERISRPGLSMDAVASLDPATNTFTEWPFTIWNILYALWPDSAGNVWFGGRISCCWTAAIARLEPATNTITQWTLPENEGDSVRAIMPAPDGTVFFTFESFTGGETSKIARLDPATDSVTLWPLAFPPLARIHRRTRMDGVRTAEGGG